MPRQYPTWLRCYCIYNTDSLGSHLDKATRDRFDVFTYKPSEVQPHWTLRKFAYLFELQVGKGRLFAAGLNFTWLNTGVPEACAMFEPILRYVRSGHLLHRNASDG